MPSHFNFLLFFIFDLPGTFAASSLTFIRESLVNRLTKQVGLERFIKLCLNYIFIRLKFSRILLGLSDVYRVAMQFLLTLNG
ncbi:uncharacterized protein L203_100492 [Cryptococcus depauperatus CBS 7841]|uniref:Secreted protein n=1 Tax=Cryptococcus depauperatus CBS 7841 TaxID=1295531 RepID=A0AAJ8JN61_9TREE